MPMVITPVVVAIVFRLIYANDAGMLTTLSKRSGGGQVEILGDPIKAFIGLVALDVWEWTPLMFLILLAGLQSLPQEPFEAARSTARAPGAPSSTSPCRCCGRCSRRDRAADDRRLRHLRPGLRADPRRPGQQRRSSSRIYGYDTSFKFQQTGYAAAMFVTIGLIVLALALAAVRLLRRAEAT